MKIRVLAIGAAALLLPFAAACSDDGDTSKPSQGEVSKSLQDNASLPEEQADCIAKEIDGKVSDKVLRAIADDDEGNISDDEQTDATEAITAAATTCVADSSDVSIPEVTVPE